MDVAQQYCKCMKAGDKEGMLSLVADDAHFKTPRWEVTGKQALRKKLASEDMPEFYGETELEQQGVGVFTRRLKVKVALGLITLKIQQTFTVVDGKIKSVLGTKL
eukprot:TRINITY_DN350_c0_g1_i3.p1 TRINITY_DN350_c0_g1~~TRINITY_DN350_c0_g1_i3.p1  ORF type:complete len:105 (+),score=49.47 TRINITY_DN350_c0_g1_i3:52-366(+)